jgi:hypothetical protein
MRRRPVVLLLILIVACSASTPRATLSRTPHPSSSRTNRLAPSKTASSSPTQRSSPSGSGLLTDADLSRATCGTSGRIVTFRVGVERGLPTTPTGFGTEVRRILCHSRSWIASGAVRFRYDPNGSLLIGLRSPEGTERRCLQLIGLSVNRTYSCGTPHEVVINSDRWFDGTPNWPGPLTEYRQMLTNHETGHALGLAHQQCPGNGAPAPVMMQQSKGLTSSNGLTCRRNPWPLEDELERLS